MFQRDFDYVDLRPHPAQDDIYELKKERAKIISKLVIIPFLVFLGIYGALVLVHVI